jgi:hypothetical protein
MEFRNAVFGPNNSIECEVNHPVYGWIPFTATPDDVEEHGRAIHAAALAAGPGPYVPPPLPSDEELSEEIRYERDALLAASDWTQLPDARASMSEEKAQAWDVCRQALRDIPKQDGFPQDVTWPVSPEDES